MVENRLGDYLRARRAQVGPDQVGLPVYGARRVPGLRREEVAVLAKVSVDYYVRLEQGRERHPSAHVLDSLSRALHLDDDARLHLFRIAGLSPRPRRPGPERIDPQLLRLMDMWPDNPAIVLGRAYDVLAGNRLAYALFDGFEQGPNLLVKLFLDPAARSFYPDWEQVASYTVAGFRVLHGMFSDDPRIAEVLRLMLARSPEFAVIWERHDARGERLQRKTFTHPEVGAITLDINAFDVKSAPGQELIVYHAEPGTASAEALALLGTLAATRRLGQEALPPAAEASPDGGHTTNLGVRAPAVSEAGGQVPGPQLAVNRVWVRGRRRQGDVGSARSSRPCILIQLTKESNQSVLVVSFGYMPNPCPPCS
jgi:transcriptional regulator with XRE-family HTH domain